MKRKAMSTQERSRRFWLLVDKNGPTPRSPRKFAAHPAGDCWEHDEATNIYRWVAGPCWIWKGRLNATGYGMFGVHTLAHRFAFEDYYGVPLTSAWEGIHGCDRPSCVNPLHVFPATHATNMRDRGNKGRAKLSAETKRKIGKANALALLGKKRSPESIAKQSESLRRVYAEGRRSTRSDIQVSELIRLYKQGLSLFQLSRRFNASTTAVYSRLKKSGVRLRPSGTNQFSKGASLEKKTATSRNGGSIPS